MISVSTREELVSPLDCEFAERFKNATKEQCVFAAALQIKAMEAMEYFDWTGPYSFKMQDLIKAGVAYGYYVNTLSSAGGRIAACSLFEFFGFWNEERGITGAGHRLTRLVAYRNGYFWDYDARTWMSRNELMSHLSSFSPAGTTAIEEVEAYWFQKPRISEYDADLLELGTMPKP